MIATGNPHRFSHQNSIRGFRVSRCILSRQTGNLGVFRWETEKRVYVTGSFTLELTVKAL